MGSENKPDLKRKKCSYPFEIFVVFIINSLKVVFVCVFCSACNIQCHNFMNLRLSALILSLNLFKGKLNVYKTRRHSVNVHSLLVDFLFSRTLIILTQLQWT